MPKINRTTRLDRIVTAVFVVLMLIVLGSATIAVKLSITPPPMPGYAFINSMKPGQYCKTEHHTVINIGHEISADGKSLLVIADPDIQEGMKMFFLQDNNDVLSYDGISFTINVNNVVQVWGYKGKTCEILDVPR